jgi:hypothetical protein
VKTEIADRTGHNRSELESRHEHQTPRPTVALTIDSTLPGSQPLPARTTNQHRFFRPVPTENCEDLRDRDAMKRTLVTVIISPAFEAI